MGNSTRYPVQPEEHSKSPTGPFVRLLEGDFLLVEDNPGDVVLISRLLGAWGCRLQHAETAAEACVELGRKAYRAVLLDLHLPDAHGLDAVRKIQAAGADVAIVVLTGLERDDLAFACLDAGVQDFVRKEELTSARLARALVHAIARHRATEMALRLELAERHAALGKIAASVAHEINNQAMLLLTTSELAQLELHELSDLESPKHQDVVASLTGVLQKHATITGHIGAIVRQLTVFARDSEPGELEPVDLSGVVESNLRLLTSRIQQKAKLVSQCQFSTMVLGSERKLGQVVLNLVTNAVDAIDGATPDGHRLTVRVWQEGGEVMLSVEDTGGGIPEESQRQVFEPLFASKSNNKSTGMGLAVCAEIVRSLGGRIDLESEPGRTVFTVALPAAEPGASNSAVQVASDLAGLRVLLIDDDVNIRRAIARLLSKVCVVVDVESGVDALAVLGKDREFDAILCDVMMPGMHGAELCGRIKGDFPELYARMALLSGGAFSDETISFLANTDRPILEKPCTRSKLFSAVAELARGKAVAPSKQPD